jgi:hypothetical protein
MLETPMLSVTRLPQIQSISRAVPRHQRHGNVAMLARLWGRSRPLVRHDIKHTLLKHGLCFYIVIVAALVIWLSETNIRDDPLADLAPFWLLRLGASESVTARVI